MWAKLWLPMGTGMQLGATETPPLPPPPPPMAEAWGGKGLEGEGVPTCGGLAGTAGLGLTSGGTTSDMSTDRERGRIKICSQSRPEEPSEASPHLLISFTRSTSKAVK